MLDSQQQDEKPFSVEIAKQGRAVCKKCGQKCQQGELRITKLIPNPSGSGKLKAWHHIDCIFEIFLKQRQTTKRIESPDDIDGWTQLTNANQNYILQKINDCNQTIETRMNAKNTKKSNKTTINKNKFNIDNDNNNNNDREKTVIANDDNLSVSSDISNNLSQDNLFREFRVIVAEVTKMKVAQDKITILSNMFKKGTDGICFKGDLQLWIKLLLPSLDKRVFNLQSKQLIKLFSKLLNTNQEDMLGSLDQGDVGFTIQFFFEQSEQVKPATKSTLTLQEIDDFLERLSHLHKEDEQINHLETIINRSTANDLKVLVRLIVRDLRMKAGVKHVLEALSPELYQCYLICKDLNTTLDIWKKGDVDNYLVQHSKGVVASTSSSLTLSPKKRPIDLIKSKKPTTKSKFRINNKNDNNNNSNNNKKKKIITNFDGLELVACNYQQDDKLERCNSIPNYFENVKLLLENGIADRYTEWIRYFLAYGGILLKAHEFMDATHVLHIKDTIKVQQIECPKRARHVIIEWIKDTVEKQSLQDYRSYSVRWTPVSSD